MSIYRHIFLLLIVSWSGFSQSTDTPQRWAELIKEEDLRDQLTILASDALEGRLTGSRGQKMAAAIIQHHFQQMGLEGPVNGAYFQEFSLYAAQLRSASLTVTNRTFQNFKDIVFTGNWSGEMIGEVIFVGGGAKKPIDEKRLKGKAVLIWWRGFSFNSLQEIVQQFYDAGATGVLIYPEARPNEFENFAKQMQQLANQPAYELHRPEVNKVLSSPIFVNQDVVNALFGDLKKVRQEMERPERVKGSVAKWAAVTEVGEIKTENVLGFLKGSDKADELIVITAHFDHIGLAFGQGDQIYNGADDDGSGTVAVMQLAKAFAAAKKEGKGPRRSILFMTVSAEEWGLFGSEYYTDHPVFPLENTVTNLNIDMIGRRDDAHTTKTDYVYVIGSDKLSTELHQISESSNNTYTKLSFDYTYNDEHHPSNLYQRSDHWNFARRGIPIIFYFDGIHQDYHRPSDEVDKIEFDLLAKRTKCIFYTAWEIANRDKRITLDR
jgi:hypothetical protein